MKIALCFAMQEEADLLIDKLPALEVNHIFNPSLPFRLFQGTYLDHAISIACSGKDSRYKVDNIGCEAATLLAFEVVNKLQPDLIISAGTAGGFKAQNACIGKVYLSKDEIVFHDRDVPLPGFKESAIGHYPCIDSTSLAEKLQLDCGIISSGSSLRKTASDIELGKTVVAKEMEAAAIAWVASLFNIPFLAVKSITNIVDEDNLSEVTFQENFSTACAALTAILPELLATLPPELIQVFNK